MTTHKLSLFGYIFGICLIAAGVVRYQIMFDDWFKFLFTLAIAGLVLAFSYLLNWMREKDIEDKKQTARLDAIVDFFIKRQEDSILDKARGLENE